MELRHLEQVLEVCRAGGFSEAARRLGVSQPTLSKSIARLEADLSLKLFDRTGGAARPTTYGAFVAERAEALLTSAQSLTRELEQMARGEEGRLRILVGPAARLKPLPRLVQLAKARFPRLHLETTQAVGRNAMMQALSDGRYDLVIGTSDLGRDHGDMIRIHLFDDRVIAAVRPEHPALAHQPLTPTRLLSHQLAMCVMSPSLKRWLGDTTREQDENLRAFLSDDYGLIKQRPQESDDIAIGPSFVFEPELRAGSLVEVGLTLKAPYHCWMLTTPERWRSPILKAMAELAKTAAAEGGRTSPIAARTLVAG
jgi:DNA-binding transcriptional LysR family regulator